jgi:hypothetical protein
VHAGTPAVAYDLGDFKRAEKEKMAAVYLELVSAKVAPADRPYDKGIEVAGGRTKPFLLERSWIGPMGHYWEQWSLRRPGGEAIHKSEPAEIFVRGFQSIRTFTDRVDQPVPLEPGKYEVVFHVEGIYMGSTEIEVSAATSDAAA